MLRSPHSLRELLILAWPVIIARATQSIIGFADTLMVAPLGAESLAAVTTGGMNAFSIVMLPMGIAFIVQSFASQLKGKNDLVSARRYAWYGLILTGICLVFSLISIPLVPWALSIPDFAPGVRTGMTAYLSIRFLAVAAAVGIEVIGNWYGGLGDTRPHMRASVVVMVVNVGLNYLLIEGNLGAPALGVEGAAWASTIAVWVGFLLLLGRFLRDSTGRSTPRVPLRVAEFARMMRFGIPNGLNWFLEFAAFALFINFFVGSLGTASLAAMMAVFNVNSVAFMPAFGLSSAGAILVGQDIGSGHKERVPATLWLTMKTGMAWMGTIGLLYLLMPEGVMALFATDDASGAEFLEVGSTLLALSTGWLLFDAVAMAVSESLRAAGDTAWPTGARIILAWCFFLPLAGWAMFVLDGGHVAAMIAVIAYIAALAGVLVWRFRRGRWRDIELTEDDFPVL